MPGDSTGLCPENISINNAGGLSHPRQCVHDFFTACQKPVKLLGVVLRSLKKKFCLRKACFLQGASRLVVKRRPVGQMA